MLLLSSEYSPPPWPPCILLSSSRSGSVRCTLRGFLDRLGRFSRLSTSVQLSTQVVALPFGLLAPPALLGHPLVHRGLRHLAAGTFGVELLLSLSLCRAGLCPIWRLLDRLSVL